MRTLAKYLSLNQISEAPDKKRHASNMYPTIKGYKLNIIDYYTLNIFLFQSQALEYINMSIHAVLACTRKMI